ncbi:hypothetical protein [Kitasatospora sp. MAP5-34]|uniref:hypothetical protein n=1 Tax=Kitasatospora sp. MAP5-34 TaxID=3035102 RepID=UPI00247441F8|nr:hypothetical protein [Kitasatospora sp. MAP5-34]MDH6580731.1 hypothetical protein [Kitasatospora sp. MAP5-34]
MFEITITTTPTTERPVTALTGVLAAVYTELCGKEGATAAALALAAEVSPSAARKALVALEQQGLARRTPGGNDRTRRLPDHWYPATPGSVPPDADQSTVTAEAAETDDEVAEPQCGTDTPAHADGDASPTPQENPADEEVDAPYADAVPDGADSAELTADPLAVDDIPAEDPAPGPEAAVNGPADPDNGSGHADAPGEDLAGPMTAEDAVEQTEPLRGTEPPAHPEDEDGLIPQGDPAGEEIDNSNTADSAALAADPLVADDIPTEELAPVGAPGSEAAENDPADPENGSAQEGAGREDRTSPPAGDDAPTVTAGQCCPTCGTHLRPPARKRSTTATSGGSRLVPGQLHQMILDHLRANPETDWSPTKISQALGRSSGAISNALTTMVTRGEAVMTSAQPRRYQAAPTATEEKALSGD